MNWKKSIGALLLLAILTCCMAMPVQAKTTKVYTVKKVALKEYASKDAPTITKVKRNTKLTLVKKGKTWSECKYKQMPVYVKTKWLSTIKATNAYTATQFKFYGVIRWRNIKWTWYSQRVLPGGALKIPGRTTSKDGYVIDKYGFIVLASNNSADKGKIVATPFSGRYGKIYDCGAGGSNWYDVYTNF